MMTPAITGFDHLVLYCRDVETTLEFYTSLLGLQGVRVDKWRAGEVLFPSVRVDEGTIIDLLQRDDPVADKNVDHLCLVADADTVDMIDADRDRFEVVDGPGYRYGARGDGWSIYITDPDNNTVEIRTYDR